MLETQETWRRGGPGLNPIDRVGVWECRDSHHDPDPLRFTVASLDPSVYPKRLDGMNLDSCYSLGEWQERENLIWQCLSPLPEQQQACGGKGDREADQIQGVEQMRRALAKWEVEYTILASQLEEARKECERLTEDRDSWKRAVQSWSESHKAACEQIAALTRERDAAQERVKELERNQSESKFSSSPVYRGCQAILDEYGAKPDRDLIGERIRDLGNKMRAAELERDNLQEEIAYQKSDNSGWYLRTNSLKDEVDRLEKELERVACAIPECGSVKAPSKDVERLVREYSIKCGEAEKLRNQCNEQKRSIDEWTNAYSRARCEVHELQSRLSSSSGTGDNGEPPLTLGPSQYIDTPSADHEDHDTAAGFVMGEFTKFLHAHGDKAARRLVDCLGLIPRLKRALLLREAQT